jgi:hypothetical protein
MSAASVPIASLFGARQKIDQIVEVALLLGAGRGILAAHHAHQTHVVGAIANDVERLHEARQALALDVELLLQLGGGAQRAFVDRGLGGRRDLGRRRLGHGLVGPRSVGRGPLGRWSLRRRTIGARNFNGRRGGDRGGFRGRMLGRRLGSRLGGHLGIRLVGVSFARHGGLARGHVGIDPSLGGRGRIALGGWRGWRSGRIDLAGRIDLGRWRVTRDLHVGGLLHSFGCCRRGRGRRCRTMYAPDARRLAKHDSWKLGDSFHRLSAARVLRRAGLTWFFGPLRAS